MYVYDVAHFPTQIQAEKPVRISPLTSSAISHSAVLDIPIDQ